MTKMSEGATMPPYFPSGLVAAYLGSGRACLLGRVLGVSSSTEPCEK
jgi:hypothetical protein